MDFSSYSNQFTTHDLGSVPALSEWSVIFGSRTQSMVDLEVFVSEYKLVHEENCINHGMLALIASGGGSSSLSLRTD